MKRINSILIHSEIEELDFVANLFIVITNPNTIPPHIGICCNENYYSLKVTGKDTKIPIRFILRNAESKDKPIVFLKLKIREEYNCSEIENNLNSVLQKYEKVEPNGPTCLAPVTDFLSTLYDAKMNDVIFLYHLINYLSKQNFIHSVYVNRLKHFSDSKYVLIEYDRFQLSEALNKIKISG